jgi:mannosyltransferase OCH1-like enzyme
MIPRRIIQTGRRDLPLLLQAATAAVKLLHPDFEYLFFDDEMIERFLKENFPDYLADYHSFQYRIQKYDFFRYLAIYHYGGFYLDLDVFLARDLVPLLDLSCVFAFEELAEGRYFWDHHQIDWQLGNYAFGAEAGHPFLDAIIKNCLRAKHDRFWAEPMMKGIPFFARPESTVLNTTGPGLVSRTFAENITATKDVTILFPEDVCDRARWHHFGQYGVHHMMGSWRGGKGLLLRQTIRIWENLNLRRILRAGRSRRRTPEVLPAKQSADKTGERNQKPAVRGQVKLGL